MIRSRELTYRYPSRHAGRTVDRGPALSEIDLALSPSGHVALLGTSGSGKSTLALCLAGLLVPATGEIEIDGLSTRGDRRALAWRIGCVFQQPAAQLLTRHVADEIALPLEQLGWARPDIWRRVAEVLDGLGLAALAARDPQTLSGGEMQRVALAAAIAPMPRYVFLDEPLAHLDDDAAEHVEAWLDRAGVGEANLRLDIAPLPPRRPPERVVVLEGGRLVANAGRLTEALAASLAGASPSPAGTEPDAGLARDSGAWAPCPGPAALRAAGLCIGHGDRVLVRAHELELEPGRVTVLTGPSGSGKSTLLLTLAGLLPALAGGVESAGRPQVRGRPDPSVAYMPQFPEQAFWRRSVADELAGAGETGSIDPALARVGLDPRLGPVSPFRLSGGERRRLAIACALCGRRPIVLLDEPAAGLDGPGMRLLEQVVETCAAAGFSLLVVTPVRHWQGRVDRMLELRDGALVERAPTG